MKKIVFLLFICLNLFAKEVYDLRNKVLTQQIRLGFYDPIDDSKAEGFAQDYLKEEYAKLYKIKDVVDRDDKTKELIKKAKEMAIKPQIGDEMISGSRIRVRYEEGKIAGSMEQYPNILCTSDGAGIDMARIVFEPTTREVLKEIVNKGKITYEIVGTITKFQGHYFYLKDIKIKFFDEKNKQIDIKELISEGSNGKKFEMEYK